MPYVSGSAGDMAALRTALISACTSNGWTLPGNVLHKGNVYIELLVASGYLTLKGGRGIDGSNALTTASTVTTRLGRASTGIPDIAWPVAYEIFIGTAPDEVFLVVNYDVDKFQFTAFGQSVVPDLLGTGAWYASSMGTTVAANATAYVSISAYGGAASGISSFGLFWRSVGAYAGSQNACIDHGLDGATWTTGSEVVNSAEGIRLLMAALPSAWNSESMLLPVQPWLPRPDNKITMVADLQIARYVRMDNHTPGEIVQIGSDQWKVFPFYKKNTSARDGGSAVDHTGTFGLALRYDGP